MKKREFIPSDVKFLRKLNSQKPTRQPEKLISKFIHGLRIMPPGSPFEGIYDVYKTPYGIEIRDNMSPFSECRQQAIKKGVQIGLTTVAEDVLAYYIGERPAKIMYMSATDDLIKKFSDTRLDPLIDSCDFRNLIYSQNENKNSRKSGDKTQYKEFVGGTLALVSAQSPSAMRSESIMILIRDEIDGAPRQLSTGEGNFLAVSEGRIEAFGGRSKIMDFSTPTVFGESLIDDQYNKGDKRKFFVPCPHCGEMQYLSLGTDKSDYGLKGDYEAGRLVQGYYLCHKCHDAIFNHHKITMLQNGVWRPTAESSDKYFRSYHLPSFYCPPGLTSFTRMRKKYDDAMKGGDEELRSFTNLYLGKSFEASGESPKLDTVIEIRSKYNSKEVPENVLYLTMAADVQRGIDKYKDHTSEEIQAEAKKLELKKDIHALEKMPRLEVEVYGHGEQFRTSSIEYKHFYGRIDDHTSGAWKELSDWAGDTGLIYKRKRDGFEFQPKMIFIDSGDGKHVNTVYSFCEPWGNTYAIKGSRNLKKDKLKEGVSDEMSKDNYQRFKLSESGIHSFIVITTNYYKNQLYKKLKNKTCPINGQPANCHQTPFDYPDRYFKALTLEKQRKDGSFHNISQGRNEAMDLAVYNMCASDFYIEGLIKKEQERLKIIARKQGRRLSKDDLRKVNRKMVTDNYISELKQQGW